MSKKLSEIVKKRKAKKPDLEQILDLLKAGDTNNAIFQALRCFPEEKRLVYLYDALKKSKFRSFKKGMQDIESLISDFLSTGNKSPFMNSVNEVRKASHTSGYRVSPFEQIKESLFLSITAGNDIDRTYWANNVINKILELEYNLDDLDVEDINAAKANTKRGAYAAEIVSIIWPGNEAVKVLYG